LKTRFQKKPTTLPIANIPSFLLIVPFSRNIIEAKKKLKTTNVIVDSRLTNRKEASKHKATICRSEKGNNHLTIDFTDNALSPSPFQ